MSQQIHWCSFVICRATHKSEGQRGGGLEVGLDRMTLCQAAELSTRCLLHILVLRSRMKHSRSCVKPSHGNSKGTKGKSKHTRSTQSLACIPPLHVHHSKANHMAELLQGNVIQVYLVEPKRTAISQKN